MTKTLSGFIRPMLIILAMLALSACSSTMQSQSLSENAGKPVTISMKEDVPCACCDKMKKAEGKSGCCDSHMKGGCSGMSNGKGMICVPPKTKGGISSH